MSGANRHGAATRGAAERISGKARPNAARSQYCEKAVGVASANPNAVTKFKGDDDL